MRPFLEQRRQEDSVQQLLRQPWLADLYDHPEASTPPIGELKKHFRCELTPDDVEKYKEVEERAAPFILVTNAIGEAYRLGMPLHRISEQFVIQMMHRRAVLNPHEMAHFVWENRFRQKPQLPMFVTHAEQLRQQGAVRDFGPLPHVASWVTPTAMQIETETVALLRISADDPLERAVKDVDSFDQILLWYKSGVDIRSNEIPLLESVKRHIRNAIEMRIIASLKDVSKFSENTAEHIQWRYLQLMQLLLCHQFFSEVRLVYEKQNGIHDQAYSATVLATSHRLLAGWDEFATNVPQETTELIRNTYEQQLRPGAPNPRYTFERFMAAANGQLAA